MLRVVELWFCDVQKVREGPNRGHVEPAIIRKIPLQDVSKVSARFVADGSVG